MGLHRIDKNMIDQGFVQQVDDTAKNLDGRGISVKDRRFGAIGNGQSNPLSKFFPTLTVAKMKYPHATSLSQEVDWCAFVAAFDFCKMSSEYNKVIIPDGHYIIPDKVSTYDVTVEGSGMGSVLIDASTWIGSSKTPVFEAGDKNALTGNYIPASHVGAQKTLKINLTRRTSKDVIMSLKNKTILSVDAVKYGTTTLVSGTDYTVSGDLKGTDTYNHNSYINWLTDVVPVGGIAEVTLTVLVAGTKTIMLNDVAGLSNGDFLKVSSSRETFTLGNDFNYLKNEIVQVEKVDTANKTVEVYQFLRDTYSKDFCSIQKINTSKGVSFRNFSMIGNHLESVGIEANWMENARYENLRLEKFGYWQLALKGGINTEVNHCFIKDPIPKDGIPTGTNYCIVHWAHEGLTVKNSFLQGGRHAFSGGDAGIGISRGVRLLDSYIGNTINSVGVEAVDSHPSVDEFRIQGCTIFGGILINGRSVNVSDNKIYSWTNGVRVNNQTSELGVVTIKDNEITLLESRLGSAGVSLELLNTRFAEKISVKGNVIKVNSDVNASSISVTSGSNIVHELALDIMDNDLSSQSIVYYSILYQISAYSSKVNIQNNKIANTVLIKTPITSLLYKGNVSHRGDKSYTSATYGYGLILGDAGLSSPKGNVAIVDKNTFYGYNYAGLNLEEGFGTVTISDNTFDSNCKEGTYTWSKSQLLIDVSKNDTKNITVHSNKFLNTEKTPALYAGIIRVIGASSPSIKGSIANNSSDMSNIIYSGTIDKLPERYNSWNPTVYYFNQPPTTGSYLKGDIVYNTSPVAGGSIGWIYTDSGTWKEFGLISE